MATNKIGLRTGNVIVPLAAGSMMPAGTIISYSGSIAAFTSTASADSTTLIHKDGWAVCNGASIPLATYSQLYARLSTTWNAATNPLTGSAQSAPADTGTNFRIPNLQGVFLRGVADYAGSDAYSTDNDVALAAYKVDKGQGHKHALEYDIRARNSATPVAQPVGSNFNLVASNNSESLQGTMSAALSPITDGTNGTPRVGKETNPKQVGVYYLVKLYDNLAAVDVYIQPASASVSGIVDTSVQSFAGVKTFNSGVVVPTNPSTPIADSSQNGTVYSGTYTPTITNVSGVTVVSTRDAQFIRVGNVVTVSGNASLSFSDSTDRSFKITTPIARASNFGSTGVGGAGTGTGTRGGGAYSVFAGAMKGNNGEKTIIWESAANGSDVNNDPHDFSYTFTYTLS